MQNFVELVEISLDNIKSPQVFEQSWFLFVLPR